MEGLVWLKDDIALQSLYSIFVMLSFFRFNFQFSSQTHVLSIFRFSTQTHELTRSGSPEDGSDPSGPD